MAKLNLETFNEILFKAVKDKKGLLEAELDMVNEMLIEGLCDLADKLNEEEDLPPSIQEQLDKVNNLKDGAEKILNMIKSLEEKEA